MGRPSLVRTAHIQYVSRTSRRSDRDARCYTPRGMPEPLQMTVADICEHLTLLFLTSRNCTQSEKSERTFNRVCFQHVINFAFRNVAYKVVNDLKTFLLQFYTKTVVQTEALRIMGVVVAKPSKNRPSSRPKMTTIYICLHYIFMLYIYIYWYKESGRGCYKCCRTQACLRTKTHGTVHDWNQSLRWENECLITWCHYDQGSSG